MLTAQGIPIDLNGLAFLFLPFLIYELTCGTVSLVLAWLIERRPGTFGPLTALGILALLGLFWHYILGKGFYPFTIAVALLGILAVILASVHGYSLHYALRHRPYWPYLISTPLCVALAYITTFFLYRGGDALGDTWAILILWTFIGTPLGVIFAVVGVTAIRSIQDCIPRV